MMRKWIGLLFIAALAPGSAHSGTSACGDLIRVTTLLDEDRPAGCTSQACSLREAIALANACQSGNTTVIALSPGRYALDRKGFAHPLLPPPLASAPGDSAMIVTGRARIEGEGAVISRALDAPPFRLFDVAPDAWLALVGVRLSGGLGGVEVGSGINIREGGRLLPERSHVSGAARLGGGIYAAGAVWMRDSLVQGGQADRGGGLFVAPTGTARIDRSEFTMNLAEGLVGYGGAIEVQGKVTIRDSAFTGNAARHGAAISVWPPGRVWITGGLIADNSAAANSGALELLDSDEIAEVRFERNAPQDCVFRYVQDRATRGCSSLRPARSGSGSAEAAPDRVEALAEQ